MAPAATVVTVPEQLLCEPGTLVTLSWTVANPSEEPWPPGCTLRPVDAAGSLGSAVLAVPEVQGHSVAELGLELQVPDAPGARLSQRLSLTTAEGTVFGDPLEVLLELRTAAKAPSAQRPAVRNDGPNPRPHPHLGVYPGDHTRGIYLKFKPDEKAPKTAWQAPLVVEETREEMQGWHLVEPLEAMPSPVLATFGTPEATELRFMVNGEKHVVRGGQYPISTSLAEYLRYQRGLTGTKIGCGEGGCGACTVALRAFRREEGGLTVPEGKVVMNACLRPLHSVDNMEITTIENLGSPAEPHPVQQSFHRHSASQCGMCTPGMVMAIYGILSRGGGTPEEMERCIQGNLCRCTGYRPIYDAIREVSALQEAEPRQAPRPPAPVLLAPRPRRFAARQGGQVWLNCFQLEDVFTALREYAGRPHRLVVGNTAMGVAKYYPPHPNDTPEVYINIQHVQSLLECQDIGSSLEVGAAVSLASLIDALSNRTVGVPQFRAIVDHLLLVAHPQVRSVGSWAGNVMLAKMHIDFPSDVCLLLTLLDAELKLISDDGAVERTKIQAFLKNQDLPRLGSNTQIIQSVVIPYPSTTSIIKTYKIMRRKMNAHADLNAGFMFDFTDKKGVQVSRARVVVGNVHLGPLVAERTCEALRGQLTSEAINAAKATLVQEVTDNYSGPSVADPPFVVVSKAYKIKLAGNLLCKAAFRARAERLGLSALSPEEQSAAEEFKRAPSRGTQSFSVDASTAPIGQATPKYEGLEQACGTAAFTADLPLSQGAVFGVPVLADKIGTIHAIDTSACLQTPGVRQVLTAQDVSAVGASLKIQGYPYQILASADTRTGHVGQFVALVLGESPEAARIGAREVMLTYSSVEEEPVLCLDQALARGEVQQQYDPAVVGERPLHREGAGLSTIEGALASSGQRHLYMETQTTYAAPSSSGGLVVNTSCQVFDNAQQMLAGTLHMDAAKITIQNTRVGGAYGGKAFLYAPVCAVACVAALRIRAPVLVTLDRSTDFLALGGRTPFDAKWKVTYDSSGRITGLTQDVTSDAGADPAGNVTCTGLNCYDVPAANLNGHFVLTSTPTRTIMRAPGPFEGAFIMEAIVEQVAQTLGVDHTVVAEANHRPGMDRVWAALKRQVSYDRTRAAVTEFNASSRYQKQGLYCMGASYGFEPGSWYEKCIVSVHADGSVIIRHTGIELGQGINTKAMQACAKVFKGVASDFPMNRISIVEPKSTSFFDWRFVMATWGSATSETVSFAVDDACRKLASRLSPYATPGRSWSAVAAAAGAPLTAEGAHVSGDKSYDVSCAGCARVQVDALTGETQILSYDLVYDCGKSLNPAVDIGQMEGSLVQAMGFALCEQEYRSDKDGRLVNCGTWDYKVPSGLDIPVTMNITLLEPAPGQQAGFLGSKASGEPAQLVGSAVFFAVKDAIHAARRDIGLSRDFRLDPPASPERVLLACSS